MEPYQRAAQEQKRQGELPTKALKTAGSIIGSTASLTLGGQIMSRALPLLSPYVPEELAIKGLNKIDPRFGKFINKAMSNGAQFEEIKEFIKGKGEEGQEQAKQDRNIIEQYSPELHQFIDQQIKGGKSLEEAGNLAFKDPKFSEAIRKLSIDHKASWSRILQNVYSGKEQLQPIQTQPQQMVQQQGQQGGQTKQQLLQAMQALSQQLKS